MFNISFFIPYVIIAVLIFVSIKRLNFLKNKINEIQITRDVKKDDLLYTLENKELFEIPFNLSEAQLKQRTTSISQETMKMFSEELKLNKNTFTNLKEVMIGLLDYLDGVTKTKSVFLELLKLVNDDKKIKDDQKDDFKIELFVALLMPTELSSYNERKYGISFSFTSLIKELLTKISKENGLADDYFHQNSYIRWKLGDLKHVDTKISLLKETIYSLYSKKGLGGSIVFKIGEAEKTEIRKVISSILKIEEKEDMLVILNETVKELEKPICFGEDEIKKYAISLKNISSK